MNFGTVDLVITAVVVISVIFAFYRGLLRELLGITGWILAGLAPWSPADCCCWTAERSTWTARQTSPVPLPSVR